MVWEIQYRHGVGRFLYFESDLHVAVEILNSILGVLNDLWQWNFQTKMWTWWRGSSGINGLEMGKNTPFSTSTTPSSLLSHAIAVDPRAGFAVMFGGSASAGGGGAAVPTGIQSSNVYLARSSTDGFIRWIK